MCYECFMDLVGTDGKQLIKKPEKTAENGKKIGGEINIILYADKTMDFKVSGDQSVLKAMLKTALSNHGFKQIMYDAVKEDMEESLKIATARQAATKDPKDICSPFGGCTYNDNGYCLTHHTRL